jgi:phosphoribosylformylglycinamidine synthase
MPNLYEEAKFRLKMRTLILSGYGTNCEKETAYACERGGAAPGSVEVRHISEIYSEINAASPQAPPLDLADYRFLVLIGGFLDGDDLGGARACANRFRYRALPGGGTFLDRLRQFVASGGLVLGICNGFQLLVRLGLLPGESTGGIAGESTGGNAREITAGNGRQTVTLTTNAGGRFEDRWVRLKTDPASPCIFTRDVEGLELPVRHGEGQLVGADEGVLESLVESRLAPLRYTLADGTPTEAYPDNPNGTAHGVAALCNPAGTVMGLMPHPEAYNHHTNHPQWTRRPFAGEDGAGIALFRNAYAYLESQGA